MKAIRVMAENRKGTDLRNKLQGFYGELEDSSFRRRLMILVIIIIITTINADVDYQ